MQIDVSVMLKSIDAYKNVYILLTQSTATFIVCMLNNEENEVQPHASSYNGTNRCILLNKHKHKRAKPG